MIDEKILGVLRTHTDVYVSGEELCRKAGVTRAMIWKRMETLRAEGYEIEASPHLGYRLAGLPDRLIPSEVRWGLATRCIGREIISYRTVDSTNDVAYDLAEKGIEEGLVVLAEEQARGKGRQGRSWVSPAGAGIYLSCILRPKLVPNEIARITLLAAVAVAGAIREETGLPALIKWPNDVLVNGKKVCGILTEMKAEQDAIDFVILGIGINVNTDHRHLPQGATSLAGEAGEGVRLSRVALARRLIGTLEREYALLGAKGFSSIVKEWKRHTAMIGSRVRVNLPGKHIEGHVHDIDADGCLVIRLDSGVLRRVSSGDVVMVR